MKIILILFLLISLTACAHKKNCQDKSSCGNQESYSKSEVKPTVSYGGHCPMGLTQKMKIQGNHQYRIDYKGKHYIFSSPEARDVFMSKIDHHIKKADAHWETIESADRIR